VQSPLLKKVFFGFYGAETHEESANFLFEATRFFAGLSPFEGKNRFGK